MCKFNNNSQNIFNGNQIEIIEYKDPQGTVCSRMMYNHSSVSQNNKLIMCNNSPIRRPRW